MPHHLHGGYSTQPSPLTGEGRHPLGSATGYCPQEFPSDSQGAFYVLFSFTGGIHDSVWGRHLRLFMSLCFDFDVFTQSIMFVAIIKG